LADPTPCVKQTLFVVSQLALLRRKFRVPDIQFLLLVTIEDRHALKLARLVLAGPHMPAEERAVLGSLDQAPANRLPHLLPIDLKHLIDLPLDFAYAFPDRLRGLGAAPGRADKTVQCGHDIIAHALPTGWAFSPGMQFDLSDLKFSVKFNAGQWEAGVKGLPGDNNLAVRAEDPLTALTALIEHVRDVQRPKTEFPTITGESWRSSLIEARATSNEIARQIASRSKDLLGDPDQVHRLAWEAFGQLVEEQIMTSGDFFIRGFKKGVELARR
jgi:hypothetical protein